MLEQFSATVEMLYAAAGGSASWSDALLAIENLTDSTAAVINLVPKGPNNKPKNMVGSIALENVAEWEREYMVMCPRVAAGLAMPNAPYICDYMILSEAEMDRDPVYEWYQRHDLRYFIGSTLVDTPQYKVMWSLQRSKEQGHAQRPEIDLVELLNPHLAQALTLAVRLGTLDQQCRFDLALIDAMPQAVFALDRAGKVVMTNARAEGLLSEGDALVAVDGKLECRLGSDHARFDSAVAAALDEATIEHRGGWVRIERTSSRRALMAFVAPLISSESPFGGMEPKALIIIGDAAEALAVDEKALHDLFNLTQVEARLACALSAGHSIESAAALFGVQPETVRSELKSVFRKTSVNRQQDLVRLITSLSLTPRGPSARA
jgi:DNA-binding CsgD family transcriptional regulator/PAS domain-containing protein